MRPDPPRRQPDQAERQGELVRAVRRGPDDELRVTLEEYEGNPYISVRLWTFNRIDKVWMPTRKGCSVRLREAREVSAALLEALDLVDRMPPDRRAGRLPFGDDDHGPRRN
jgi:hypothetical protein